MLTIDVITIPDKSYRLLLLNIYFTVRASSFLNFIRNRQKNDENKNVD